MAEREAEMQDGDHNEESRWVLYISPDPKVCDDNLDMIEFLLVVTSTNTITLENMSQVLANIKRFNIFVKAWLKNFVVETLKNRDIPNQLQSRNTIFLL